jgi:hypothetical protein
LHHTVHLMGQSFLFLWLPRPMVMVIIMISLLSTLYNTLVSRWCCNCHFYLFQLLWFSWWPFLSSQQSCGLWYPHSSSPCDFCQCKCHFDSGQLLCELLFVSSELGIKCPTFTHSAWLPQWAACC